MDGLLVACIYGEFCQLAIFAFMLLIGTSASSICCLLLPILRSVRYSMFYTAER